MGKVEQVAFGKEIIVVQNPVSRFLFSNTLAGLLWLCIRLYLGYTWIKAGWGKFTSDAWIGAGAGSAIEGFLRGAVAKAAEGQIPVWYGGFIETVVLPNVVLFSYLVTFGELLVGIGLIIGLLTGIAAFFGAFMNFSFLLAGAISVNPVMFILALLLVLAWKVAGWYGVDRWALPYLRKSLHTNSNRKTAA